MTVVVQSRSPRRNGHHKEPELKDVIKSVIDLVNDITGKDKLFLKESDSTVLSIDNESLQ